MNTIKDNIEHLENLFNQRSGEISGSHEILEILRSLLNRFQTWITIGDYNGLDAAYIKKYVKNVLATDLIDIFLKRAKKIGLIDYYEVQDAHHITHTDENFDMLLCKDAFHHFEKPYIALYEMIRVAKYGVVLLEPSEPFDNVVWLPILKFYLDKINTGLINIIWKNRFSRETVGNYVFKLSIREIEKIACALNLYGIGIKWLNPKKTIFRNFLSYLGIIPYDHVCIIIMKKDLKLNGFQIVITNKSNEL